MIHKDPAHYKQRNNLLPLNNYAGETDLCAVSAHSHGDRLIAPQLRAGVPEAGGTLSATASTGETCVVSFSFVFLNDVSNDVCHLSVKATVGLVSSKLMSLSGVQRVWMS